MKKIILAGAIGSLVLTASAFAMSDDAMMAQDSMRPADAMMKHDVMQGDSMMKSDSMMMKHDGDMMMADHSKLNVSALAKAKGYVWLKDRASLAKMAGLKNYRGTAAQNAMIRKYLLTK